MTRNFSVLYIIEEKRFQFIAIIMANFVMQKKHLNSSCGKKKIDYAIVWNIYPKSYNFIEHFANSALFNHCKYGFITCKVKRQLWQLDDGLNILPAVHSIMAINYNERLVTSKWLQAHIIFVDIRQNILVLLWSPADNFESYFK